MLVPQNKSKFMSNAQKILQQVEFLDIVICKQQIPARYVLLKVLRAGFWLSIQNSIMAFQEKEKWFISNVSLVISRNHKNMLYGENPILIYFS